MPKPNHYDILGVRVDALDMATAIQKITVAAQAAEPARYLIKPYVEFLHQAGRNPEVAAVLNGAWLSLPDGVSTQWAAAYLYGGRRGIWRLLRLLTAIVVRPTDIREQIPEKFGGTVFTWRLLEAASRNHLSIYLVSSPNSGDISNAVAAIKERLPELTVAGTWPGRLDGKSGSALLAALSHEPVEQELLADLKRKRPDLILVGMGFPLQEAVIAKLAPQLQHGVLVGEGGTFDYDSFGGNRRKAPEFLQRIGLEWLWRLILEPSRLRRQLAVPSFVWAVYRAGRKGR